MHFTIYNYIYFLKQLCVFFTPIDSFHYYVHNSILIIKKLIVYKIFYIVCQFMLD